MRARKVKRTGHSWLGRGAILAAAVFALMGCGSSSDESDEPGPTASGPATYDPKRPYAVDIDPEDLTTNVDNPLFPAPVGAKWVYENKSGEGVERIEITVESETKDVWGTSARIVRDTATLDGELIEDTWDWYAQDDDGHVWYLGEETYEYENGEVVCSCGAWTAGQDGALPGVVMPSEPQVGHKYRQEYYKGEAEDWAEVLSADETVTVPAGTFEHCLKTRDRSAIDPNADEYKYYCPGVGQVLTEEGDERVELLEYSGL